MGARDVEVAEVGAIGFMQVQIALVERGAGG